MYSDFYFTSFFPFFPPHLPLSIPLALFQPYFNIQFLPTSHYQRQPQSYTTKQNSPKQETQTIKKQSDSYSNLKIQTSHPLNPKKKENKSIFHNYQKHLVTTLKQKITIDQVKDFDPEDLCLKELWLSFTKAKIANRALLLAVFGEQKYEKAQVIRYLEKSNLSWISQKFTAIQIKEAQVKIREIVKQYFQGKNLDIELAGRKLPEDEKPIFKHYVNYFLSELAQGTLNRRLPKRYKRQMML